MSAWVTLLVIAVPWALYAVWQARRPSVHDMAGRIAMLEVETKRLRERLDLQERQKIPA